MKIVSIKFDDYLANWITNCAIKNNITVSEFIRDLLYEKMQQGALIFSYNKKAQQRHASQISRSEMGYIIFTAKLLEKFVLANQEQGEILRNLAFEETESLLNQLNLGSKGQRFSIRLETLLFAWLKNEANRLQLKLIPLIRKIIEVAFSQSEANIDTKLSSIQKTAITHQIRSCKLLEKLIHQTIEDPANLIAEIRSKTENTLAKMLA